MAISDEPVALPSFDRVKSELEKYEYTVIYLNALGQPLFNGDEPKTIAISKDLSLEITRVNLPWEEIRFKNPAFKDTPVVIKSDGTFDLYYRCSEVSSGDEFIAGDEEGFPIVETIALGPMWPPPEYRIDGSFKKIPTITREQRNAIRTIWKYYDKRLPISEIARKALPAAQDIMPAPAHGFPPITDENLALIFETMKVTQHNMARVFEERYRHEFRYCDVWGQWMHWVENRWETDQTLLAFHNCRMITHKINDNKSLSAASASFARGVETLCKATPTFATKPAIWDRNTFHLNTPAGVYNLETGEMDDHCREYYITKITRVAPAEGSHPIFDRFLNEITLGDRGLQEYLQRALGACLSGALQDNFLLFFYGTGQNGKNTFGDLITWILGDYAKVIPTETLIASKHPQHLTILANLRGLRLAVCSEVSEGSYWDEARIKSLTGDAQISANYMHQDLFEFDRTHKHLVYGNHRPLLRIVDPGVKSRLHIVPFKAYFSPEDRDPMMRQKLEVEAPTILDWLIVGHQRWLEDGYLKKCDAVQRETDSYFESQSTTDLWFSECCEMDPDARTQAKELYVSFKYWKESRGEGVMSQTRWGEWMRQAGLEKVKSSGVIVYKGVVLRPTPGYLN